MRDGSIRRDDQIHALHYRGSVEKRVGSGIQFISEMLDIHALRRRIQLIGRIAFLFTDIKGSTDLYNRVGDARAYGFVREHYAVLTRAVREHDGAVVKTIGDAVMAAFTDPLNALDAALAIRDDIALFNRRLAAEAGGDDVAILVKIGLHSGACIAVTLNDRLDYLGRTVNLAARLQGESAGGDIVLSAILAAEHGVAERVATLDAQAETARVKGFAEPVALRRIPARE